MLDKKMHDNEIAINESLVRQLLRAQFPQWAELPLALVQSMGTDNTIYHLGTEMCVRLPRMTHAAQLIEKEQKWLPLLAPQLPLATPVLLGKGNPSKDYPWHWSIYRWLKGEDASVRQITDLNRDAIDLAHFLIALQKIDTAGGPLSRRGVPLATREYETYNAIKSLHGIIDTDTAAAIWQECLQAPVWDKSPVWTHGDLLPANFLIQDGLLKAVIDFGIMGIGDPACDMIVAWSFFSPESREIFRKTLAVDDATWMRGRGWALSIGLIILPYYQNTNPGLLAVGKRMIHEILNEW